MKLFLLRGAALLVPFALGSALGSACNPTKPEDQGTGGSASGSTGSEGGTLGGAAATGGSVVSGGGGATGSGASTGGAPAGGDGAGGGAGGERVAGTDGYDCNGPQGSLPTLTKKAVADGLVHPSLVTHAGTDPRLFIVEHDGRVRIVDSGSLRDVPFLDISDRVASAVDGETHSDRGLAGLAFHPNYAKNGIFYVHYQAMAGASPFETGTTVVSQFVVSSSDPDVADAASEHVLFTAAQPGRDHNGGTIAFGSDGMLYVALGDGTSWISDGEQGFDPAGQAQDPGTPLGAILRIKPSPSPGAPFTLPAGNLQETVPDADGRVWDYGLRNPFRMNFDGCTGVLYIGDVGYQSYEEIDIELPSRGGKNYGWPIMEGPDCVVSGCSKTGLTRPQVSYPWSTGVAVIGGTVYRGSRLPALRGSYIYSDFFNGTLKTLVFDAASGEVAKGPDLVSVSAPTSIQNGPDGEVYMTSYTDGVVYRLEAL